MFVDFEFFRVDVNIDSWQHLKIFDCASQERKHGGKGFFIKATPVGSSVELLKNQTSKALRYRNARVPSIKQRLSKSKVNTIGDLYRIYLNHVRMNAHNRYFQ